ncbi:MAG: HNH endonuclease [Desulfurellales bacterium]|nr:MAG: HNH endonuclease [Desulfurellales bacterium]
MIKRPATFKLPSPTSNVLRYPEQPRKKTAERGYGSRWRTESKKHLRAYPLCVICGKSNRITAAKCVDHIIPHRGSAALFWDVNNWQSLCYSCHSRKTVREDGGFGNPIASSLDRIISSK